MDAPQLLALRHRDRDFALEQGRIYLLGSDPRCDLRLAGSGVAGVHARLEMRGAEPVLTAFADSPVLTNGFAGGATLLRAGDSVRLGDVELRVVRDHGNAELLPLPELVAARVERQRARAAAIASHGIAIPASQSFTDLMAQELRRAPWLGLSLLLHALLLLLLFWLFPPEAREGRRQVQFGFDGANGPAAAPAVPPELLAVAPEHSDPRQQPLLEPLLEPSPPDPPAPWPPAPTAGPEAAKLLESLRGNPRIGARPLAGDDLLEAGGGSDPGGFRATVAELRRTGLDVVFVFDSTGSMGSSIQATRTNIAVMLEALRALVPQARFALVTYRDRGRNEEYLVRSLPLGSDFYAAINFVHGVEAGGGGDWPEAVLAGLRTAFQQPFRSGARRVVVLAGDAPGHAEEERMLLEEVRAFARDGRSFVHTLCTAGSQPRGSETRLQFQRIAERGRGVAVDVEEHGRILLQVLTLAFGPQFAGNLATVQQLVDSRRPPVPTWAMDLARRGGDELIHALRRADPPAEPLVQALLRSRRQPTALALIDALVAADTPPSCRQAAAHVLRLLLELPAAPIDAAQPRPLRSGDAARLRSLASSRLPP